jgi:hypothetical protein
MSILEAKIINPVPPDYDRKREQNRIDHETLVRANRAIKRLATSARKSTVYGTGSGMATSPKLFPPPQNRKQRRAAAAQARGRRG